VEVDCHGATGVYLYHFDNFAEGSANTMVQVITLALADLSTHLAKQGYKMPSSIGFQFDNSGENKNRTVFAFLSHLVTALRFTEIFVSCVPFFSQSLFYFVFFRLTF
jgi:hypothetical protein